MKCKYNTPEQESLEQLMFDYDKFEEDFFKDFNDDDEQEEQSKTGQLH